MEELAHFGDDGNALGPVLVPQALAEALAEALRLEGRRGEPVLGQHNASDQLN